MLTVRISSPQLGPDECSAVQRVMESGHLVQGPEVEALEREFAALVDGRACVAVASGTSALHLGLLAAGVGPGDEVVVPSFSFAATANAVSLTGATPVFADVEPDTFCLSADSVEAVLTPKTVGVMPVHLYGHCADMTRIGALADRSDLAVFEDAAQAHAATWRGRPAGAFGRFAAFSLYATKNITAGEGGVVVVDDDLSRAVRLLRNQGMELRYHHEVVGFNARMTDLHAAVGRVQLRRVHELTAARRANADVLLRELSGVPGVVLPAVRKDAEPVWHQFTVRVQEDRDGFAQALMREHGVETGIYYPVPIHRSGAHARDLDLPVTEQASREVLSLPVHPALGAAELDRVVCAVRAVAGAGR